MACSHLQTEYAHAGGGGGVYCEKAKFSKMPSPFVQVNDRLTGKKLYLSQPDPVPFFSWGLAPPGWSRTPAGGARLTVCS